MEIIFIRKPDSQTFPREFQRAKLLLKEIITYTYPQYSYSYQHYGQPLIFTSLSPHINTTTYSTYPHTYSQYLYNFHYSFISDLKNFLILYD